MTSTVDYKQMVRSAEKAGFNPLTALRNGGAAGFTTTTTPGLSGGAVLANAVGGAAQSFLANFDPFADRRRETEFRLAEAQIANLNADTRARLGGFGMSPAIAAGPIYRPMGRVNGGAITGSGLVPPGIQSNLPGFSPNVAAKAATDELINPFPVGSGIVVPGHIKSGEAWENFMGDLGTVPATVINVWETTRHNTPKGSPFRLPPIMDVGAFVNGRTPNAQDVIRWAGEKHKKLRDSIPGPRQPDPFAAWGY